MKGSPILIAWLNAQDKQTNSLSVDVHVTQDHISQLLFWHTTRLTKWLDVWKSAEKLDSHTVEYHNFYRELLITREGSSLKAMAEAKEGDSRPS